MRSPVMRSLKYQRVSNPLITQSPRWASHNGTGDMRRGPSSARKTPYGSVSLSRAEAETAFLTEAEVLTASSSYCFCLSNSSQTHTHTRWQRRCGKIPKPPQARYLILIWRRRGVMNKNRLIMGSLSHEKRFWGSYLLRRPMNAGAHYVWPSDGALAFKQNGVVQWSCSWQRRRRIPSNKEKVLYRIFQTFAPLPR